MSRRGVSQLFTGFWVVGLYYFISVSIRLYLAIWKRIINSLFLAIVNIKFYKKICQSKKFNYDVV